MASLPNPTQFVAHEFVRQYYTILHRDPAQLHRFYTKESKFTHGGTLNSKTEELISGQEAIFEKIRELNFRESYAKIRSVDSHPTLGNGVVIQVTGELSNAGMPMRKFMQTFVLARQAAKKYSVYNDIFRYQDEIFDETENDDTVDGTIESDSGLNNNHEVAPTVNTNSDLMETTQVPINNDLTPLVKEDQFDNTEIICQEFVGQNFQAEQQIYGLESGIEKMGMNEQVHNQYQLVPQEDQGAESSSSEEQLDESTNIPFELKPPQEEALEPDQPLQSEESISEEVDAIEAPEEEVAEEPAEAPVEESEKVEEPAKQEPSAPFSWAALAKKNTQPPAATTKPLAAAKQAPPVKKPVTPKPVVPATTPPSTTPPGASPQQQPPAPQQQLMQQQPAPPSQQQVRKPPRTPREGGEEQPPLQQRRRQQAPDSHQIFIGNLPYGCTESDIRALFEEFGSIVEIRLNPKNFGFVAFDNPDSPVTILGSGKQFTCGVQTINIEVKQSASNSRRNDRNDRGNNDRVGGDRGGGNFRRRDGPGDGRMSRGGDQRGDQRSDSRQDFNRDNKRGGGRFGGGIRRPTSSDNRGGADGGEQKGGFEQKGFEQKGFGQKGGFGQQGSGGPQGGARGEQRPNQQQSRR